MATLASSSATDTGLLFQNDPVTDVEASTEFPARRFLYDDSIVHHTQHCALMSMHAPSSELGDINETIEDPFGVDHPTIADMDQLGLPSITSRDSSDPRVSPSPVLFPEQLRDIDEVMIEENAFADSVDSGGSDLSAEELSRIANESSSGLPDTAEAFAITSIMVDLVDAASRVLVDQPQDPASVPPSAQPLQPRSPSEPATLETDKATSPSSGLWQLQTCVTSLLSATAQQSATQPQPMSGMIPTTRKTVQNQQYGIKRRSRENKARAKCQALLSSMPAMTILATHPTVRDCVHSAQKSITRSHKVMAQREEAGTLLARKLAQLEASKCSSFASIATTARKRSKANQTTAAELVGLMSSLCSGQHGTADFVAQVDEELDKLNTAAKTSNAAKNEALRTAANALQGHAHLFIPCAKWVVLRLGKAKECLPEGVTQQTYTKLRKLVGDRLTSVRRNTSLSAMETLVSQLWDVYNWPVPPQA